jgi:serine/threonine-protein kinase RsbT
MCSDHRNSEATPMTVFKHATVPLRAEYDVVRVQQKVREWARQLGVSLVSQTQAVTAASELARNAIHYGGGGTLRLEIIDQKSRYGLQLTFEDEGPGIPEVALAPQDGYTTGGGLGLGMGGAERLVHEFEIVSRPGEGMRVRIVMWK